MVCKQVPILLDGGGDLPCLLGGQQCHETDVEQVWNRALEACQWQTPVDTGQIQRALCSSGRQPLTFLLYWLGFVRRTENQREKRRP